MSDYIISEDKVVSDDEASDMTIARLELRQRTLK